MNSKQVRKLKSVDLFEETSKSMIFQAMSIVKNEVLLIEVTKQGCQADLIYLNSIRKLFTDHSQEYSTKLREEIFEFDEKQTELLNYVSIIEKP